MAAQCWGLGEGGRESVAAQRWGLGEGGRESVASQHWRLGMTCSLRVQTPSCKDEQ